MGRPARTALTLALGLASASVAAPATVTRAADQRIVAAPHLSSHLRFGSTVAMSRGTTNAFALVGSGNQRVHRLAWDGSSWSSTEVLFNEAQTHGVDIEGAVGYHAFLEPAGDTTVLRFTHSGTPTAVLTDLWAIGASEPRAIAIHDGVLAVGFPDSFQDGGLVWLGEPDGQGGWLGQWLQGALGDRLGAALAAKPGLVVIGAPGRDDNGAVLLLLRTGPGTWIIHQTLAPPALSQTGAAFGAAVDIDADDGWIAVGAPDVDRTTIPPGVAQDIGAVYLFENVGFGWELAALLRPSGSSAWDHFGASVAIDGDVLVAGAPGEDGAQGDEGAAYVYRRNGADWETVPRQRLIDPAAEEHDALGSSVAVGALGALVGSPFFDGNGQFDQGAVLFYRDVAALFLDNFESGDLAAWSAALP